ncbi:MAG TPA: phosphoribosylglycinamide formyltransferase [Myxococcales bacterium]|nr:phosphoribosylglycinamide formyltransferase [Myxococcales bacterium]
MTRIGVLASGSGSNLQAILDAKLPVAVVISNVPGAKALARAEAAGVPALLVPHRAYPSRDAYDAELVRLLRQHQVDLVCLAGFMRILTPTFLCDFKNRILNIHPALLPAFPGMHAARQALQAGVRISGCTVHIVDEGTDTGPIVIQAAVPVLDGDSEDSLAERILRQEHRIYPRAIRLFGEGRVSVDGRRVTIRGGRGDERRTIASPTIDE